MSLLNTLRFILGHPLNRGDKLDAAIRFAKWQVGSRLVPGAIVYDWVNGSKFIVKTGETGLTGNVYTGLHEFSDMGFLLHFLRPDDAFIDVGANVGSYTILACSAIGARGVAFEPVPSTYEKLIENMRLNQLTERVKCFNKGVGDQQGAIVFTGEYGATNHAIASGEQCDSKVTIECVSLDVVLESESPSLIKVDVEGYETLVLNGAQQVLKNESLSAVIMELNGSGTRYGFDESQIVELMLANGFRTYGYDPIDRSLVCLEGKNIESGNTLFLRNIPFVERRLRDAPKVRVLGRQF